MVAAVGLDMQIKFAMERSHQDSRLTYENAKSTAHTAMLVNGGAATAVLAFVGKEHLLKNLVSICLATYALGVLFGALVMMSVMVSVYWWNQYWEGIALPGSERNVQVATDKALKWRRRGYTFFGAAMACFILSSWSLAVAYWIGLGQ